MTTHSLLTSIGLYLSINRALKFGLVFLCGLIAGGLSIQIATMQVDVQMQTMEKGSFQYFFDTGDGFSPSQSKMFAITSSPHFFHYRASIHPNNLRAIRIDPIDTQGRFELLSLQVDYLFWHRKWYGQKELSHLLPTNQIEINSTDAIALYGLSTGSDPSLVTRNVKYIAHWHSLATILFSMFGGFTALLLFFTTQYFGGYKTISAHKHTILIIIVIISAICRIGYWNGSALSSDPSQLQTVWYDESTYFDAARQIMQFGFQHYFLSEQSAMIAPTNPVYIAILYTAFKSVNVIRIANIFLSIFSIVLIYGLGRNLFGKPVGLIAAGILSVHGQLIQYSPTLLTEPLFIFLFVASIYCIALTLEELNCSRYRYICYAIAASILLTLAILTRSIAILLPLTLFLFIGVREAYSSWRLGVFSFPLLKRLVFPLLLPFLLVSAVAAKNYIVFDRFVIATGSGAALWLGSRADTDGDEPPYRGRSYDTASITHGHSHLSLVGDKLLMEAARVNISLDPLGFTWLCTKKIGRLLVGNNFAWFYPYHDVVDLYNATGEDIAYTAYIIFQIFLACAIVVFGLLGFVTFQLEGSRAFIVPATIFYLIIFSIPFLAIQRYGLPIVTLLSIPASGCIYRAWRTYNVLRWQIFLSILSVLSMVFYISFFG